MNQVRFSAPLWLMWFLVVGVGLFVPLMDNDSAHHANIALRMYLTGDYVRLIDYEGPYLDKPHLHFWLSALSYHVFGVTGFAYKFPSFLFSLIGVLSVYRAGALLISDTLGKMGAMIFATSASFLLALNDVRMDALLTAAVAYSIWQFAGYVKTGRFFYLAGLALGAAIGFCVKGHIGVLIPLLFILSYCYTTRSWRMLWRAPWLLAGMLFFVFISPVVYCYYLQFNLHPELMVRGKDHIDGVRFILWDQSLGRYSGEMGGVGKTDRFFFFHTFLWVFAPWGLLGVAALMRWRPFSSQSDVSKSVLWVLLVFGGLVAFSSFKLPHYLNVILPLAALWIGSLVGRNNERIRVVIRWLEWVMWILLGVFSGLLLIAWFPEQPFWFWAGWVCVLGMLFYILQTSEKNTGGSVNRIAAGMLVLFWMLNAGFYPRLLEYQGGNVLAKSVKPLPTGEPVYSLTGCYSSSFYFYSGQLRQELSIKDVLNHTGFLVYDEKQEADLLKAGARLSEKRAVLDYEITKLNLRFLNPETRQSVCTKLVLSRLN